MKLTATEKAKELIDLYYVELEQHKGYYDFETARQCAIICVNEILKNPTPKQLKFYIEVRHKLEEYGQHEI